MSKLWGKLRGKPKKEKGTPGLLSTPWRILDVGGTWTEDYANAVIKNIKDHTCDVKDGDMSNIRILLLGQVKAGKSSLINTVASIDKGRISQVTIAGGADSSLTTELKEYKPQHELENFEILDTMGVENNELGGLNPKDVVYLVKGHIKPTYKFNPASPIEEGCTEFRSDPKINDKIHCVAFVTDANNIGGDNISDAMRASIKTLQDQLKNHNIPRIVILTKIDLLCELVEEDIQNTYRSIKVRNAVNLAEELYKVPIQNIFPVQNYQFELQRDIKKEILPLLALRQMIYFASDFLESVSGTTRGGAKGH